MSEPKSGPESDLTTRNSQLATVFLPLDRLDARRHTFGLLLEHLVAALRDEAPDLEVVLVRRRGRADVRVEGVREVFVPRALERNAVYARLGPAWMRRRGAALVHFPFLYAPATWAGGPARRVVTIHGASRAALGDELVSRFSDADLGRTRRRLAAFDRVITVSESSKREVVEHYRVPPERVTVVYNGVGEGFNPGAADPRVLAKYGIRRPYVLTVSTIKPKKNVAAAVRAFAALLTRHPGLPHSLVLVGYKARGYTEVDDAVRETGLEGRVVQTGWTESAEIPAFYAAADALLFPSLHEGFGLPVVEAMASGCPVAASRVYSIPEVGGDAILTFEPHDTGAIARELERAILDEPLRRRLVADGLARAERFRWAESARRTAAVYREVLSSER
jgi:glycosyltransferase involved in cell wall biosynthesis